MSRFSPYFWSPHGTLLTSPSSTNWLASTRTELQLRWSNSTLFKQLCNCVTRNHSPTIAWQEFSGWTPWLSCPTCYSPQRIIRWVPSSWLRRVSTLLLSPVQGCRGLATFKGKGFISSVLILPRQDWLLFCRWLIQDPDVALERLKIEFGWTRINQIEQQ